MFTRSLIALLVAHLLVGQLAASEKAEIDDYKALGILNRNCAGCHQAADHPGALFLNQARLSEPETIELITKLVQTGQMPPAHGKFRQSADGKTLLRWLKSKKSK